MGIDNKFNDFSTRALNYAKDFAIANGNYAIGSEHILIGLIREGTGIAAKMLQGYGLTEDIAIKKINCLTGIGFYDENINARKIKRNYFTPAAIKITERSYDFSKQCGSKYIGTEHILMAILRSGDNIALRVLISAEIPVENLFEKLMSRQNLSTDTLQSKPTPALDKFGKDITELAKSGKLDKVIGRQKELERLINILSRRNKNNPCIIGEPGVGKTAIVEALAQKIVSGEMPDDFTDKRIVALDISSMVAGTKYRGDFEDRLKRIIDEVRKNNNVILFIDELHNLVGAGSAEGSIDAANILKPLLARGEFRVIGATTISEYRRYIEKDKALERRFQPVIVREPSVEETIDILTKIKDRYEKFHNVTISDETIKCAVDMSVRYIQDRFLPDKAIDLIDEASSNLKYTEFSRHNPKLLNQKYIKLINEIDKAIELKDFDKATKLQSTSNEIMREIANEETEPLVLTTEHIKVAVSTITDIPVTQLNQKEANALILIEEKLKNVIKGQDEAVKIISKAIKRGRIGLNDPKKPIGTFIFAGPTGVGKTEISKQLAKIVFGSENALVRLDMSEYMEKHSVSKLIGAPPGYIGYDEGGQLTEKIRRKPYSVILLDEIEKAHHDIFNILLQILDDGKLTDTSGRTVDFRNTVIIMTTNIGAREITEKAKMGFENTENNEYKDINNNVISQIKKLFKPELLNRIDNIIVFKALNINELKEIASNMMAELKDRLLSKNIMCEFSEDTVNFIVDKCKNTNYGARPIKRAIQDNIENLIAEKILSGDICENDCIRIEYQNEITVKQSEKEVH